MTFYGFKIPDDRKEIIKILKSTKVGNCVSGSCDKCPIHLGGNCLACTDSIMNKYPHLKRHGSSIRRDILYKEYLNLKQFVQEELEV